MIPARKLITEEEYTLLNTYRNAYVFDPDADDRTETDPIDMFDILETWESEKQNLIKMLGNRLIISKPVSIHKNAAAVADAFEKILGNNSDISHKYEGAREFFVCLQNFLSSCKYHRWAPVENFILTPSFDELNDLENWIINRFQEDIAVTFPNGDIVSSKRGGSLVRFMGKLIKRAHDKGYISNKVLYNWEQFRTLQSVMLNDMDIEGDLCLSAHPMDFFTASDNDSNWHTCTRMNYNHGVGDYRGGITEMMNSPYVLCAYIKAAKDMRIDTPYDSYSWNNKIWRSFYIITSQGAISVRGFPFDSKELDEEVLTWIAELSKQNSDEEYFPNKIVRVKCADELQDYGYGYWEFYTFVMYNDFWRIHSFMPSIHTDGSDVVMYYGENPQCLICGDLYEGNEDYAHRMTCPYCESQRLICDSCHQEYDSLNLNGMCDSCYQKTLVYDIYDILMTPNSSAISVVQTYNVDNIKQIYFSDYGLYTNFKNVYFATLHSWNEFPEKFLKHDFPKYSARIPVENLTPLAWQTIKKFIKYNQYSRDYNWCMKPFSNGQALFAGAQYCYSLIEKQEYSLVKNFIQYVMPCFGYTTKEVLTALEDKYTLMYGYEYKTFTDNTPIEEFRARVTQLCERLKCDFELVTGAISEVLAPA